MVDTRVGLTEEKADAIISFMARSKRPTMLPVKKWVGEYINSLQMRETTQKSYRTVIMAFFKKSHFMMPTTEQVKDYIYQYDPMKSTSNSTYLMLRPFFQYLEDKYNIPNPMAGMKPPKAPVNEPVSFTLEEFEMILDACKDEREKGLIHLYGGMVSGCRREYGRTLVI